MKEQVFKIEDLRLNWRIGVFVYGCWGMKMFLALIIPFLFLCHPHAFSVRDFSPVFCLL
jgi:hypothetical protein